MKKILKVCVCGLAVAALAAGCSKKPATEETTAAATTAAEGTEETAEAAETVDLSTIDNGTVTLGDYKGIEVTKPAVEVTDEEVEAAITQALTSNAEYVDVDRAAQDQDTVDIDYVGTKDGVAFDGGTAEGQKLLLGSGQFIDGFEAGLVGAKKGDEVTLNLTFPENYGSEELAGQAVEFKVTVNSVQEKKTPVLDDAFVQSVSDFKSVDEYREDMKQSLLSNKEANADAEVQNTILKQVIEAAEITTNQEAIDANYTNFVASYTNQAAMYGMDLATMASMYGMDEETFKSYLKLQAESAVQQRLVFGAIAEQENITITDEDRDAMATEMGYENKEALIEQAGQYSVDDYLISTKTMEFLIDNAVIK